MKQSRFTLPLIFATWFFLLLFTGGGALAQTAYPQKVDKYVNDFANVIDDKVEAELDAKLKAFDTQTTNEIVIATFPELKGSLEEVSNQLFRTWGIGKKETNNGAAFFIFLKDENGKGKTRIEIGKGLEGVIPDSKAKLLYERQIKPHLVKRDFTSGVTVAADQLMAYAKEEITGPPAPAADTSGDGNMALMVSVLILGLVGGMFALWKILIPSSENEYVSFTPSSSEPYPDYNTVVTARNKSSTTNTGSFSKPRSTRSSSTTKKKKTSSSSSYDSGDSYSSYSSGSSSWGSSDSSSSSSSYDSGGGSSDGGGSSGDF